MHAFSAKLIAFARSAGALNGIAIDGERSPEQRNALDMLLAACAATTPPTDPAAVYGAAAQADPVKRVRRPKPDATSEAPKPEPKPKAAKPEPEAEPVKPSKPNASDKRADYDKRAELVGELRNVCATLYNGPSLAVRSNPKRIALSVYSALLTSPKHRTTLDRISTRDESFLFTVIKRGDTRGRFDPAALNLDSGIFSRLASVGFIVADGDTFALSPAALTHARNAAKRAA